MPTVVNPVLYPADYESYPVPTYDTSLDNFRVSKLNGRRFSIEAGFWNGQNFVPRFAAKRFSEIPGAGVWYVWLSDDLNLTINMTTTVPVATGYFCAKVTATTQKITSVEDRRPLFFEKPLPIATESQAGIASIASVNEAKAYLALDKILVPGNVPSAASDQKGVIRTAIYPADQESNLVAVTPRYLLEAYGSTSGGFKNKIIGGDFLTNPWQRGIIFTPKNTSSNVGGYNFNYLDRFTADCFYVQTHELNSDITKKTLKTTREVSSDGTACLKVECTSTLSMATFAWACIGHIIEGRNYAPLHNSPFTLSFWVNSSVTGLYSVSVRNWRNGETDAWWVSPYTINVANQWEKKVVVINDPSINSGGLRWNFDETIGLMINWWLAASPNFSTDLTNRWGNDSPPNVPPTVPGYVAVNGTTNAVIAGSTFKIKDVQLEQGIYASPMERVDAETVLRQCERYYQKSWNTNIPPLNPDQDALSDTAKAWQNAVMGSSFLDGESPVINPTRNVSFSTNMRATPTVSAWIGVGYPIADLPSISDVGNVTSVWAGTKGFTASWSYSVGQPLSPLYMAWTAESSFAIE